MKLIVNVIGCSNLYSRVQAEIGPGSSRRDAALLKLSGLATSVIFSASLPAADTADGSDPCTIVVIGSDDAALAQLAHMRGRGRADHPAQTPVIAILEQDADLPSTWRRHAAVSEWLFADFAPGELAFRILGLIANRRWRIYRLAFGTLDVSVECRTVFFNGRTMRLTPSEFALAELFLRQPGSVISLSAIAEHFEQTGKSGTANNIRVCVHQLRLKFEQLSAGQLTIAMAYGRGYSLKQRLCPPSLAPRGRGAARSGQLAWHAR